MTSKMLRYAGQMESYQKPNRQRRYVTETNERGQLVHTTFRVWRRGPGYASFATEEEARAYHSQHGVRIDRIDTTIIEPSSD